jgi:hypothetical protein
MAVDNLLGAKSFSRTAESFGPIHRKTATCSGPFGEAEATSASLLQCGLPSTGCASSWPA